MHVGGNRIVFIEFNELCPDLLARWMADGTLPNFRRFHDASQVFTGAADVTDPRFLEPWIQWYSLHTGLSYDQHEVFHLTDGPTAGHTDVWHALLDGGITVGNCASMNAPAFAAPGSFYLPDPWCMTEPPFPAELAAYQKIIVSKVQENSNAGAAVSRADYIDFAKFLVRNGLRTGTVMAIVEQLVAEISNRGVGWKRAALLDKLQLDIFLKLWKRNRPAFASFFLNSTAHFQHAYFHLLEPGKFDLPQDDLDDPVHQHAILFGYKEMDRILGDFFALEREGVTLVLSTALSQQPNEGAGKRYYRPRNIDGLLAGLDLYPTRTLPVMAHQYSALFATQADADAAHAALAAVSMDGQPVFGFDEAPERTLFFNCQIGSNVAQTAQVQLRPGSNTTAPFYELFYKIPHMKTGIHHPDSVLWFKTGVHAVHEGRTSILNIFPTMLDYFDVPMAPQDGIARQGHSILDETGMARFRAQQRVPVDA